MDVLSLMPQGERRQLTYAICHAVGQEKSPSAGERLRKQSGASVEETIFARPAGATPQRSEPVRRHGIYSRDGIVNSVSSASPALSGGNELA